MKQSFIRNSAIGAVAFVLFIGFIVYFVGSNKVLLPENFRIARMDSARTGNEIARLTSVTSNAIKDINVSELKNEHEKALSLIKDARAANTMAYQRAFELAVSLQKLTESLREIESQRHQQLAYEAVAVELALVSEFIVYTKNLNSFLDDLSLFVETRDIKYEASARINLRAVNEKADVINKLNKEFVMKMDEFDKSL